ncbi:uncharacterized protein ColSpa_09085 [Colletotrichum spaethianum]|uniref:Uncharacterized protein n=1 Tax=Colletotrichum spaethianum TaxID=700344 RepID=A0AA37PB12_9PEZI|nr:uncharacterized protein ColSpa_09085 [Colletotrichum spaethianum]GKT48904.1 hypothetical protein ColSpa_09085 [Colletotrichum spaethianum]
MPDELDVYGHAPSTPNYYAVGVAMARNPEAALDRYPQQSLLSEIMWIIDETRRYAATTVSIDIAICQDGSCKTRRLGQRAKDTRATPKWKDSTKCCLFVPSSYSPSLPCSPPKVDPNKSQN